MSKIFAIDELRNLNKAFLTPDDVHGIVGMTAQKIRDLAMTDPKALGFPLELKVCGEQKRNPRIQIPRESFLRWYDGEHCIATESTNEMCFAEEDSEEDQKMTNFKFYRVSRVAEILDVSDEMVCGYIKDRRLEAIQLSKNPEATKKEYRVSESALIAFIKSCEIKTCA